MDLELTDEQRWLSESVETLLARAWPGAGGGEDAERDPDALWQALVAFGGLSVDRDDGLGAVELCLIARALGAHLACAPYVGSAAVRFAAEPLAERLPEAYAQLVQGDDAVSVALLEPGRGWAVSGVQTALGLDGLHGRKVAVEHADSVDRLAVVASVAGRPGLVLLTADAPGVAVTPQPAFDPMVPMSTLELAGVDAPVAGVAEGPVAAALLQRLVLTGGLLAAAEAVGAARRLLDDARSYASERRQFGRTIGSYQALRHILADMYVRQASMWSTVLYAAAALDDDLDEASQTAAVAKAYVSRSAREVAHGAMQVFGGIAFTEEHPAHRFLRRIVVREQQFGDAAHHEREIGRTLAAAAAGRPQRAGDGRPAAVSVH
jgi:alkylation response protein AidB-like acyl-CoA dehydrogenase